MTDRKIAIAGAGAIGCFVGGLLRHSGQDVCFLARPRIIEMLTDHGLTLTDYSGFAAHIPPSSLRLSDDPSTLREASVILVTVKSGATEEIALSIASHARKDAVVVSLQNGVSNADRLRAALPGYDVRAGMVAYNVLSAGSGRFHKGTSGVIAIEDGPGDIAASLAAERLDIEVSNDMRAVQWGKLLLNLNNALNALSGLPLREQLMDIHWRRIAAAQIEEALAALAAEGIKPHRATPLPPRMLPMVLRLPNFVYSIIAGASLKIDPNARSSMWEDLEAERKTEIDELQGAVIGLCEKHGLAAPICARVADLINKCEKDGGGSPSMTPDEVMSG